MTPVAVMGSKKLPPVANFDNNNEENGFGNMFKGDLRIYFRLVLLSPRSFNFELESEVSKELRLFRNLGAQSSGDYLTGLN